MKYRIIVNPIAGNGAGNAVVPAIETQLRALGLDFDLIRTERRWHAAELAQAAADAGIDVVVAVGGDGTANEVLNGLMLAQNGDRQSRSRVPALGVLSVGRGNDFAFGMGIPHELEAGCQTLAQGRRRTIDVGQVFGGDFPEGRYFGNGIGIGFDAVVGFVAARQKRLSGFLSYIVATLKTTFLYYKAPLVSLEYDGNVSQIHALMVSIMNGRRMGGGFMMAPQGDPGDGQLDLCIARQVPRLRIFGLVPHFMKGTQATQSAVVTGRTRQVTVTALEGTLPAHADGETLCTEGQELTVTLLPAQIELITAAS